MQHILLLLVTTSLLTAIATTAIAHQNWAMAAVATTSAALTSITILLIANIDKRRYHVERWIQQLSEGNYDYTIEPSNNDRLSELCSALETLPLSSIKATQLGLVQSLSNQLQAKNEELELASNNLTTSQQQAVSQQRLANLGELASGVAHELRNPLNFVQNYAEDALANTITLQTIVNLRPDKDSHHLDPITTIIEDIRASLQRTVYNTYRADEVVSKLVALNRTAPTSAFQLTHLPSLITEQAQVAYTAHAAQNPDVVIAFIYDYHPQTPETNTIPNELARAIYNIVANSTAAITRRHINQPDFHGIITISTEIDDANIMIHITDNGVGIDHANLTKVFTPFYTTKEPNQGTSLGLGLSITLDITRQHRGHIEITSEPNSHTTVTMTLPKTATQPALDMDIDSP